MAQHGLPDAAIWAVRRRLFARPARDARSLSAARSGPIVVAGMFRTASGVGESARSCSLAFTERAIAHRRVDLSAAFGQVDLDDPGDLDPMPNDARGTLILHANPPETAPALHHLRLYGARRWRIVGCWVWELSEAPASWREARSLVSELWAPSAFCRQAFHAVAPPRLFDAPYRVVAPDGAMATGASAHDGKVAVLTLADGRSSLERKNTVAAIRIFKDAVGDRNDARLIVKTRNLSEFPYAAQALRAAAANDPRIEFIDRSLSPAERWRMISDADILLSPHRAEGFGLTIAEAMATGRAVLATDWSGNVDFMPDNPACRIGYRLVPVSDAAGAYAGETACLWAEPDEREAAEKLRWLINDRDLRIAAGEEGRRRAAEKLNGDAIVSALRGASAQLAS